MCAQQPFICEHAHCTHTRARARTHTHTHVCVYMYVHVRKTLYLHYRANQHTCAQAPAHHTAFYKHFFLNNAKQYYRRTFQYQELAPTGSNWRSKQKKKSYIPNRRSTFQNHELDPKGKNWRSKQSVWQSDPCLILQSKARSPTGKRKSKEKKRIWQ